MENLNTSENTELMNTKLLDYAVKNLMSYGFYDESGKYNIVLNQERLKRMFNADIILLEERARD